MSTLRRILSFLILAPVIFVLGVVIFTGPQIASLRFFDPTRTAFMWQRPGPVFQTWIPLKDMAPSLKEMVLGAEDANFYRHHGIDFREMEASWKKDVRKKKYARGFSTITMQLARNIYLTPHKSIVRKALEILIALEMEAILPKGRIVELYLNLIEWGDGVYGAEAASQHYFKKSAKSLTLSESAFLAAIIPSPRKWGKWPPGPYISKRMNVLQARGDVNGIELDPAVEPQNP